MQSEVPSPGGHDPSKGLPPVTPPSGKYIAQLFLVPGLIVTVAVLVLVGFTWLVAGESNPQALLDRLENANPDIRWRAANELAHRLERDDQLAANPKAALRLAEILRQALDDFGHADQSLSPSDKKDRKSLLDKRKDVEFLTPCLGHLAIPVGMPLITDLAQKGRGKDQRSAALLRRKALSALILWGQNLQRFANLCAERRDEIVAELRQEAENGRGDRARWAELAVDYLQKRHSLGIVPALAECAKSDDIFLRELVPAALTPWEVPPPENELLEQTLLTLSYDDGHGVRIEIGKED